MCFPESIRKKVMGKAGYCCCICRRPSVSLEVHHIIPKAKDGDDSIENAASLCPNCHSDYGSNPEKRTQIKRIRDWWYKKTEEMYTSNITSPEQLGEIHVLLQNVDAKQDSILKKQDKHESDFESLKSRLKVISNKTIESMTPVNSDITTSSVMTAAVSSIMAFGGEDIVCRKCSKMVDVRHNFCPHCGQYLG